MSVTQPWAKAPPPEFKARWAASNGVVAAEGELDAANADQFAEYVARCIKDQRWLTLDLAGVTFIGTAGFSALHRINVACSAADVRWAMRPSRAVARLLLLCDPDGVLPVADSATAPDPDEASSLQLVPESG